MDSKTKAEYRITPGWLAGVMSLHGSTVSAQLHPRPAFLPIFDYPGVTHGDALPRWRRSAPPTLGFKNGLQKPTSN